MKNSPLAIVCIFFCLGIWAARYVYIPLFFLYVSCVLFLLSALLSFKKQSLFSLSLSVAIFLGGFIHLTNSQTYPANHISNFVSEDSQKVYVMGKVVSNPEVSQTFYGSEKTVFTFRTSDLKVGEKWQAVEGLIKATLYGKRRVQYGDELLLQGALSRPPGLRNPGGFDYRRYLAHHNIFALLKVKEKDGFLEIASLTSFARNDGLLKAIFKFKQGLHRIIWQHLDPPQAALLSAILLGERSELSQDIKDLFINTGTIHILAISGLHVGLIVLILLALLRFLRMPRRISFALVIFILIGYAVLSGARPSVVRATIMATVVLFGLLLNREINIYNSLGLAALIILGLNPRYLFDAGFQLSFLSVLSIVYFTPRLERLFPVKNRYLFYLLRFFSVSLAAWIGVAPVVAFYFSICSPVAVLANLIIVPGLFVIVAAGLSFLIFTYLWAPLGAIFAQSSWLSLVVLTRIGAVFSKIPFGFFHCPKPGISLFLGYYFLLLVIFNRQRFGISKVRLAIVLLLIGNVLVWQPLLKAPGDKLKVTFLDVGHGDAIFIQFPYQGTMLIDSGPRGESDSGRMVVLPFLWEKGVGKIDAMLLTHPDDDHVGGLASVLRNVKVNYVFDNGMPKDSISYNNYKRAVSDEAAVYQKLKGGEKILGFPQAQLFVLHPPRSFLTGTKSDINNNSVVLKLVYGDVSFIFCADLKEEGISEIVPYKRLLDSDVIKVPHHGSDEAGAEDYLFRVVSPRVAVISVDRNNRFGLPAQRVVDSLRRNGAKVYITGETGAVTISTDGREIDVKTIAGAEAGI